MRRSRLGAFGALCAVASRRSGRRESRRAATPPSATASQTLVAGSPSAIACGGSVDARVTLTGQPGTTGAATDVMLVLDLSGSTACRPASSPISSVRRTDTLDALDAADGTTDQSIAGNRRRHRRLPGLGATVTAPIGSSYSDAARPPSTASRRRRAGSPHNARHQHCRRARSARSRTRKSMVLISDGQAICERPDERDQRCDDRQGERHPHRAASASAPTPPGEPPELGLAGQLLPVRNAGPINKTKLISDLGAAVAMPVHLHGHRDPRRELLRCAAELADRHGHDRPGHARSGRAR